MSGKMKEVLGCDGFNIVQNNGAAAGQTVFHFHIHLIPRYEHDGAGINWPQGTLTEGRENRDSEKLSVKAFAAVWSWVLKIK